MLLYPNVLTTVGKKFVTEPEATVQKSSTILCKLALDTI